MRIVIVSLFGISCEMWNVFLLLDRHQQHLLLRQSCCCFFSVALHCGMRLWTDKKKNLMYQRQSKEIFHSIEPGSGLLLAFTSDVRPSLLKSLIPFSVYHITETTANHPLTTSSNNKLSNEKASLYSFPSCPFAGFFSLSSVPFSLTPFPLYSEAVFYIYCTVAYAYEQPTTKRMQWTRGTCRLQLRL